MDIRREAGRKGGREEGREGGREGGVRCLLLCRIYLLLQRVAIFSHHFPGSTKKGPLHHEYAWPLKHCDATGRKMSRAGKYVL